MSDVSQFRVACMVGELMDGKIVTNLSVICSSQKINRWAKYKPVRYNFTGNRPADWWRAADGKCGLSIPTYQLSNLSGMMTAMQEGITWEYLPPTGGTESPYRLDDFDGYNPSAVFALSEPIIPGNVYRTQETLTVNADLHGANDSMLGIADIGDFSACYFAAIIREKGTNSYVWRTSASPLGQLSGISVDVPLTICRDGYQYEVYSFISSAKKTGDDDPAGVATPLPFRVGKFTYKSSTIQIYAYCYQPSYYSGLVNYRVVAKNIGSGTTNISMATCYFSLMNRSDDTAAYTDKQVITKQLRPGVETELLSGSYNLEWSPSYQGADRIGEDFYVRFASDNIYLTGTDGEIDVASPE